MTAARPHHAYVTIDDAPSPDTRRKLAVLDARGITATWFCRGELLAARPQDARAILARGHIIGNHSHDHPRFSSLPIEACIDQVARTEALIDGIHAAAGVSRGARLFRFPFGDKGDGIDDPARRPVAAMPRVAALQRWLVDAGFRCPPFAGVTLPWYVAGGYGLAADTYFTWDPGEWRLASRSARHRDVTLSSVLEGIASHPVTPSSEIVVVHDFEATAGAFEPVLDAIEARGFTFIPPPGILARMIRD